MEIHFSAKRGPKLEPNFLTWLWYESERTAGHFEHPDYGPFTLQFDPKSIECTDLSGKTKKIIKAMAEIKKRNTTCFVHLSSETITSTSITNIIHTQTSIEYDDEFDRTCPRLDVWHAETENATVLEYDWEISLTGKDLQNWERKYDDVFNNSSDLREMALHEQHLLDWSFTVHNSFLFLDILYLRFLRLVLSGDWASEFRRVRAWLSRPS